MTESTHPDPEQAARIEAWLSALNEANAYLRLVAVLDAPLRLTPESDGAWLSALSDLEDWLSTRPDADALAAARAEGYAVGRAAVFALLASLENAEEATYQVMKHGREPHDAYGPAAHEYASQLLEIFIAHNATP